MWPLPNKPDPRERPRSVTRELLETARHWLEAVLWW